MEVSIDKNSGYCFGVEFAIQMAEDELDESGSLYCLGDIVHNDMESSSSFFQITRLNISSPIMIITSLKHLFPIPIYI